MIVYCAALGAALAIVLVGQVAARQAPGDGSVALRGNQTAVWAALLAGLLLVSIGALRWRVGTDYWTYAALYPSYASEPISELGLLGEPGINFIAKASRALYDDYATMIFLSSVITVGLFVLVLYRHSPAFAISIFLLAVTGPWLGSFNGVRQYLAVAIIFAAHPLILRRRFVPFAVAVAVAGLFHISALACLLLYFLPRRPLSLLSGSVAGIAALAATGFYGRILEVAQFLRPESDFGTSGSYFLEELSPLRVLVAIAPLVFYLFITDHEQLGQDDHFFVHVLLVHAAIMVAASGSAYIARFGIYTGIFLCLALPRLLPTKHPEWRVFVTFVLGALYFSFWWVETASSPELANFRWIFSRPDGY